MKAIKGAGMTYQGIVSTAETRTDNLPRVESAENAAAAESIAQATTAMDTKAAGDENENTSQQNQDPYNAQIRKAVEEVNKKAVNSEAIFGIHEATNRVTIKIIDKDTRKVIKEIPPEKTLDMIAKVWELAGLMVEEKR